MAKFAMYSTVRRYIPHILVVVVVASIMAGSYASIVFSPSSSVTPKATFLVDPLVISFAASATSGSASDAVSCSPSAGSVQLLPKSSNPANLQLSVSPGSLSCGSTMFSFVVTATCRVPDDQCKGSYTGQVQVRQPYNYRNLATALKVLVTVS